MTRSWKRVVNIVLLGAVGGLSLVLLSRYGVQQPFRVVAKAGKDVGITIRANLPFTRTARALSELRENRAKWRSLGLRSYVYLYEAHCFCSNAGRHVVTVEDGCVVSVVDAETGESVYIANHRLYGTIDEQFEAIRSALRHGADEYDVTYDAVTGVPVRTVYDFREELVDDEGWSAIVLLESDAATASGARPSGVATSGRPPQGRSSKGAADPATARPCALSARGRAAARGKFGSRPNSPRSREAARRVGPRLERLLEDKGLRLGAPIFIRIFKQSRELEVWVESEGRFELLKTWPICAYSGGLGPKLRTGDGQSPEGFYFVTPDRMNPWSRFHLSFNLGYPNAYDRHHGRTGSYLMVHGDCVSIGCYAMTDGGIEEIYLLAEAALRAGQPFFRVHVFPARMTDGWLAEHRDSPWYGFWRNLAQGYRWFEDRRRPPDVTVSGGRYVFGET